MSCLSAVLERPNVDECCSRTTALTSASTSQTTNIIPTSENLYEAPYEVPSMDKSKSRDNEGQLSSNLVPETSQSRAKTTKEKWSQDEESFLFLCKVANDFLFGDKRLLSISHLEIARFLNDFMKLNSNHRSASACQTRLKGWMKNPINHLRVDNACEELMQHPDMLKISGGGPLTNEERNEGRKSVDEFDILRLNRFTTLLEHLKSRYLSAHCSAVNDDTFSLPGTLDDFNRKFKIKYSHIETSPGHHLLTDVSSEEDIVFGAIFNIVHSLLCDSEDKTSSFGFHPSCVNVPRPQVRKAIAKMRLEKMISEDKRSNKTSSVELSLKRGPYYKLSISYIRKLTSLYKPSIFNDAYEHLQSLLAQKRTEHGFRGVEVTATNEGGSAALVTSLLTLGLAEFQHSIPDEMIIQQAESSSVASHDHAVCRVSSKSVSLIQVAMALKGKKPLKNEEDYVINGVQVFLNLKTKESPEDSYLLISPARKEEILKTIPTMLVSSQFPSMPEALQIYEKNGIANSKSEAIELVKLIAAKKEMGIVASDLAMEVESLGLFQLSCSLERHMALLLQSKIVIRVGVVAARFVVFDHVHPWFNKPKLVKEQPVDSIDPLSKATLPKPCRRSLRNKKVKPSETLKTSGSQNLNDALVYLKPWIRIDGTLNRRVLDRMLGEVLSHAMLKPGCAVLQLSLLFFPVIQPFQVRELVEILEEIGCVTLYCLQKSGKPGLFSPRTTIEQVPFNRLASDKDVHCDPSGDSILRLGEFIGDKSYLENFATRLKK